MKIGILQTAYKKAGDYGKFYNVQELGLARALVRKGCEVVLYKAVDGDGREYCENYSDKTFEKADESIENIAVLSKLTIKLEGVKYIGINGLFDVNSLDSSLDVLIYFSDTQIVVPKIYKWCVKNSVAFYPYIGVMESHSESGLKREIMQFVAKRNLAIYKKCKVFVKTPEMKEYFDRQKCKEVKLLSVGLDETVMNHEVGVEVTSKSTCSDADNKIMRLLFVGRMEEEKHPLEMITIFENLISDGCNSDSEVREMLSRYSLTMIGDGYMFDDVYTAAAILKKKYDLPNEALQVIRQVPYEEMHSYYRNSDIYINLNRVEILGMSILEAMYYKCPVVAVIAPGPKFILKDEYGIIARDADDVLAIINRLSKNYNDYSEMIENAYIHVKDEFTWEAISDKLLEEIK